MVLCTFFIKYRVGRGGRILLDRVHHPFSRKISKLDLDPEHDHLPPTDDLYDIYTGSWLIGCDL